MTMHQRNGKLVAQILWATALNYRLMVCLPEEAPRISHLRASALHTLNAARYHLHHGADLTPTPNALLQWAGILRDHMRQVDKQSRTPVTRHLMLLALNRAYQLERTAYALFQQEYL